MDKFKSIIIVVCSLISACAGPAKYNFLNNTDEKLNYSSTSEKWHPGEQNRELPTSKSTEVLFSPQFSLMRESGKVYNYKINFSEELSELFISNWHASDSLYVIVTDNFEVYLREKGSEIPAKVQPENLGFPAVRLDNSKTLSPNKSLN